MRGVRGRLSYRWEIRGFRVRGVRGRLPYRWEIRGLAGSWGGRAPARGIPSSWWAALGVPPLPYRG